MNITQYAQIIAVLIVFIIYLIELIKFIKKSSPNKWNIILAFTTATLLILYLIYNYNKIEEPKDWAQIFLTFGLVLVTALYAIYTAKQADASVKMAEEMSKTRYAEALPLLVPIVHQLLPSVKLPELPYESFVSAVEVKVTWRNVGKGVALASRLSLLTIPYPSGKIKQPLFPDAATIEVGSQIEVDYYKLLKNSPALETMEETPKGYQPRLEAEYSDIYGRRIGTVQEIRYDENTKKAFLGELYFTVNGQRLGKE